MSSWSVGLVCNAVIMLAYFLIALAIVVPLSRSHQLRTNPLGAATAAIFFTCAVHHGAHSIHMLLPSLGVSDPQGLAMRSAWGWPLALWDVVGALVAVYYWTLRRSYSSLMHGAQLFQDLRLREQQALELNDTVLQGLVVAKMALDLEQPDKAEGALNASIEAASRIITGLLDSHQLSLDLVRSSPAAIDGPPADVAAGPPAEPGGPDGGDAR
jgi:succinate dehydrogenase/fumarate reductase cytochrome b subunit